MSMGGSHQHSLLSLGTAGTPQQKVVHVLVNRLKNKLPIHSGVPLDRLEADTAVQQVIETIVELSHDSLDIIAWALCELLERVSKADNGYRSIEVLQSQLFVLKVLSVTMASRWTQPRSSSRSSHQHSGAPESPSLPGSTRILENQDLIPLDENCARYVLSVVVMLLRMAMTHEIPLVLPGRFTDLTFRDFESHTSISHQSTECGSDTTSSENFAPRTRPSDGPLRTQSSAMSVRSGKLSLHSTLQNPATKTTYEKTHMTLVKSSIPVNDLIRQYLGRIIFQISASNWSVVYSRIRNRIQFLASNTSDHPDIIDLQLMAHCALDRQRLVQILAGNTLLSVGLSFSNSSHTELSSLLVSMGPEGRVAIVVPLRAAVWNWITTFPHEFNEAIRTRGVAGGGAPERVFDLLYSQMEGNDERIFWPTLTILNCMSDRMRTDFQASLDGPTKMTRKEQKFGDEIVKHALGNTKLSLVALVCLIDVCRAATYATDESDTPLRMVAYDVVHEIKSVLTSRKPFWDSQDQIDVAVYAEALVAMFRFLPEEDALMLFSVCMEPERSEAVKLCVVRACLTLVQEASRCKWQRPLSKLQNLMCRRLRVIYQTSGLRRAEVDKYGNLKRPASRPKALWTSHQPLSDREVLLLGILSLWRASPLFHFKDLTHPDIQIWSETSNKIWDTNLDISVKVSSASCFYEVASEFYRNPLDDTREIMVAFLKTCLPPTLLSIVTNLLHTRQDLEAERLWMTIAHQLLELYTKKAKHAAIKEVQVHNDRVAAFALVEIAFLVSLTSADSNVSALAGKGLRYLARAEHQPDAPVNPTLSEEARSARNLTYEQLGDPTIMVIGRVGHQKRVRKCIRGISHSSAIYVAVWLECYWRWRGLSETVFEATDIQENGESQPFPPTWEEHRFQWQNLTLFLAALGGICFQDSLDLTSLADVIPGHSLPDEMRAMQNPIPLVSTFMADLTAFLVVPDTQIRDIARDALGSELSAKLYQKLLKLLDEYVLGTFHPFHLFMSAVQEDSSLWGVLWQRTERDIFAVSRPTRSHIFSSQKYIVLLKLIVEKPAEETKDVVSIDISSTMVTLSSFLATFEGPSSFRLKIKFCIMTESACLRSDTLGMQKNSSARRHIIDIIIGWIQPPSNSIKAEEFALENELNMACLRTSVKLLDRLELRPAEVNAGDDSVHVVARLFNKYAGALLQALDLYQSDMPASDSVSDLGSIHQKMRRSQKEADVRELVITGLAHLVSANTESGFKQCLPLAYDEDNRKRAIFAHVFARVIGQGTTFEPEDRSAYSDRNNRLREMSLALTICEVCPPGEVAMMINVLLNVFDNRESIVKFMKSMISRDLSVIENEQSIFRQDTICTRFFSAFAKIHGYNYLRHLIQPIVKVMMEDPSGCGYDLDPTRVGDDEAARNAKHVELIAAQFLSILTSSVSALPPIFREICAHISHTVGKTWPDARFAATGAFMFLRFISPALVTPELIDIEVPSDAVTLRRGLMMITKIIQNLANNIFFGKEAHMVVLNQFLKANIATVTRFLGDIASEMLSGKKPLAVVPEDQNQWIGTISDDTDIIVLHRFFDKHADKIGKELLSLSRTSPNSEIVTVNGKRAWDGLCALLVDYGAPLKVPVLSTLPHDKHPEYIALMNRYAGRDTHTVENIFLQTAVPFVRVDLYSWTTLLTLQQDQPAVFIWQLSKIDVETLDIELLMYHIFQTLSLSIYEDRTFDVVLDCTSFTSLSEIPVQALKYCAELVPSDILSRFRTTHILNANALTQKYLRRLYNVTAGTQFCEAIRVYSCVADMKNSIPLEALDDLKVPVALESEQPQETFEDAHMRVVQPRPVIITVGTTHIRITSVRLPIAELCVATDQIIPLADISDIYNVATGIDPSEFIIRRSRGGVTEYFASPARDQIVKAVRLAKGRLKELSTPLTERFSRFSNVPATLLHVGLLSVDMNDEELRGAAYDLLGAVCTYLNYDNSPIVASKGRCYNLTASYSDLTGTAGFIPGDPTAFVVQLSEKIAAFAPQLTLDFIPEVGAAMNSMDKTAQRISCIQYMSPWIKNLTLFSNPTSKQYDRSGARLRDCIRNLADLGVNYPDITSTIQRYIWNEVGKLDAVIVDVVLEELVRTAMEGGIGTRRCEAITHAIASLSSIGVRGRVYFKLRKTACKMYVAQPFNVLTDHPSWNEIATLIRFALVVAPSTGHAGCDQLYVPEILHNVTLVAGCGPALVRKSVYGIVMNLLQALYTSRTEESVGPGLLELINDCTTPAKLRLFGLKRETSTSEYTNWDPANDKEILDVLEELSEFLLKITEVGSGSIGGFSDCCLCISQNNWYFPGLTNVWRARWMSLVTSAAFQVSPAVQTRAFIALGTLATSDVEDDFLYQILVAFNAALGKVTDSTLSVVSMLRCMCKVIPAVVPKDSRYISHIFWLAVALLQASHSGFYIEASRLLSVTLESIERRGMFHRESVPSFLLKAREALEETTSQLDAMIGVSFESSFSFSLASIIFKGMRQRGLRDAAESVLRTLLQITVRAEVNEHVPNGFRDSVSPDALGYFLALLPSYTRPKAYRELLRDCKIDDAWLPDAGVNVDDEESGTPRISPSFLGINDSNTALLVTTFVGTMLSTAQGDDAETEILFVLLSDIAVQFPQIVSLVYDTLQDRIKDVLANASNPSIIRSVSTIFRVSLQDHSRHTIHRDRGSTSTLSTVEEVGPGQKHLNALEELGMQGLANNLVFLKGAYATTMINWIPGTIDDLTLALANFSRVASPEPPTILSCCCGKVDCESTQAWTELKGRLESRLILSAEKSSTEVGQALLQRHEEYVRQHEGQAAHTTTKLEDNDSDTDSIHDSSVVAISELVREKARLEKRLDQALVNTEVTEFSTKTIMQELNEARATISRLTAQHARSIGWETRLSTVLREKDDMQQERDGESTRAKQAEFRLVAMKDKTVKLQREVRRLQEALEERRNQRLESSDNLLQDARHRIQALQRSQVGQTAFVEQNELTNVLESLVADNEILKRDNAEIYDMLTESREELHALQEEVEEFRARPHPDFSRAGTPQMKFHFQPSSVPDSVHRNHSLPVRSPRSISMDQNRRRPLVEPLTPETYRHRPLTPAESIAVSEPRLITLKQPRPLYPPSNVSWEADSLRDGNNDISFAEKSDAHRTSLSTKSRAVQTEHWPHLLSPFPVTSSLSASSPFNPRSESSSFSDTPSSHLSALLDRLSVLHHRMSQADPLTLTNRLKRQNLKGADIGHLSRSTVNNIISELAHLRIQSRFLLEDDSVTVPATRKDFRVLFKLFKDIFADMGEVRVMLNDIIIDPSCAAKVSERALNPSSAEGDEKAKNAEHGGSSGPSSWMAPISKLFSPNGRTEGLVERSSLNRSRSVLNHPSQRRPTRVIPKLGPALAASTTTVNVEFSGAAVGRSTTNTISSQIKQDAGVSIPSAPANGTVAVMDIFAGAPQPVSDPWVVIPKSPRKVKSYVKPPSEFNGHTLRRAGSRVMGNTLSRDVDAVIDVQGPPEEGNDEEADNVAPLLQRTLRRRGLSDSSIHSTFSTHAEDNQPPVPTIPFNIIPSSGRQSVFQTLRETVQSFRTTGITSMATGGGGVVEAPVATTTATQLAPVPAPTEEPRSSTPGPLRNFLPDLTSWVAAGNLLDPMPEATFLVGSVRDESYMPIRTRRPGEPHTSDYF
ncbi:hypothetical protein H0H93_008893 [Arthromyces matolae]|nr:hypothetical protein H0H93_008893 [Arthromyces matolae]